MQRPDDPDAPLRPAPPGPPPAHDRVDNLVFAVAILGAVSLSVLGPWFTAQQGPQLGKEACAEVVELQQSNLPQLLTLALALVALRRMTAAGPPPHA